MKKKLRQFTFTSGRRGPFGVSDYAFELSEEMLSSLQQTLSQFIGVKCACMYYNYVCASVYVFTSVRAYMILEYGRLVGKSCVRMFMYLHVCVCVCAFMRVCVRMSIRVCVCAYMRACMCDVYMWGRGEHWWSSGWDTYLQPVYNTGSCDIEPHTSVGVFPSHHPAAHPAVK